MIRIYFYSYIFLEYKINLSYEFIYGRDNS